MKAPPQARAAPPEHAQRARPGVGAAQAQVEGVPRFLAGAEGWTEAEADAEPPLPRFLHPAPPRQPGLLLQREGDDTPAPPTPRLRPPSLLTPPDDASRFHIDLGLRYQLDPALRSAVLGQAGTLLDPSRVLLAIAPLAAAPGLSPTGLPTTSPSLLPATPTTGPPSPTVPPAALSPTPVVNPTPMPTPPTATGSPAASGEPGTRTATPGDVVGAVLALPQVSLLLSQTEDRFVADFTHYWDGSSTGQRVGFIGGSVVVGASIIGPILGFDASRNFVLPLLNDKVIPVPGLTGYGVEFRFGERDVMVGVHLDLGTLVLPQAWGFGPASLSPIGGPPGSDPNVPPPVSRKEAADAGAAPAHDLGSRIHQARGRGAALPKAVRRRFERASGADLSAVRVHTDAGADRLARDARARAFTTGRDIFFRAGAFEPASAGGARLLAHELTHTLQQARGDLPATPAPGEVRLSQPGDAHEREADAAADALLDGRPPQLGAAAPERLLQRDPDPPVSIANYPDDRALGLLQSHSIDALYLVELLGGLKSVERNQPLSFALARQQLVQRFGEAAVAEGYAHDEEIVALAGNSEQITSRLATVRDYYWETGQTTAYEVAYDLGEQYEWNYGRIFAACARDGAGVLGMLSAFLSGDPASIAEALLEQADQAQAEQIALEAQRAEWAEAGAEAVGRTVATKEAVLWWDDQVSLASVVDPAYGFETPAEAIAWATTTGLACGVLSVGERAFVYQLSEQYSLSDVLATGFDRRTNVVRSGGGSGVTLTTTDGVVLNARDTRFMVRDEGEQAGDSLAADLSLLDARGEELGSEQAFRLFKQAVAHLVLSNLDASRRQLLEEQDRFFELPGLPVMMNLRPAAGAELQRDSAALRRHLMQAATLADAIGDEPTDAERAQIEETLSAIGALQQRNPTAALMVVNHRDEDATGPAEEGDFEDTIAGQQSGDAAMAGASQIARRLANIEKVERHLREDPDAVLSLTQAHPAVLARFSTAQQLDIRVRMAMHTMQEFAEAIGITVLDLGLVIAGGIVGGPVGLALGAAATGIGVAQTAQAFENVSLLESMSELGFTTDTALATPEQVSSARMWAWIGAGLTLLDVAGFVRSASQMARLRSVLANPEVAHLLEHTRGTLGEAAQAMGTSEAALTRRLSVARGAERATLLREIREALEQVPSGGRYGHMGWPEGYTPEVLNRMRQTLLADAGDVGRVAAAMGDFGEPLTPEMLQLIKRYNFDSPGLAFSRENYDAWLRLASGRGTVSDARYMVHEASEIRAFQRAGFDFNPANWASMGRHARTRWHRAFDAAYLRAHGEALASEFSFTAAQISQATGGRVSLTREVVAAVDASFSGQDARAYMRVGEYVLADHPSFYAWAARAGETVPLDAATRARLGSAVYDGVLRSGGSMRAAAVRAGADPTLQELIAIVKNMPM